MSLDNYKKDFMKKTGLILLCSLLLTSCSLSGISDFLPGQNAAPTLAPSPIVSATSTFTPIPTQPTPTFTYTPTLVGLKTSTSTVTAGSETPTPPATSTSSIVIPSLVLDGFALITLSVKEFYLGDCEPASVKFTAQVARPIDVVFVVLFVRLKSAVTGTTSGWTDLAMDNMGAGTFTRTLIPDHIKYLDAYENPWIQYQLVAVNGAGDQLGRTQIFDEQLRLQTCPLTPFPTASATSTP